MNKKRSVISTIIGFAAVIAFTFYEQFDLNQGDEWTQLKVSEEQPINDNSHLRDVIAKREDGVMVKGRARVVKVLPDDRDGSAHQRFIVQLPSGETLLIAHNIDLAPRLPNLKIDDYVSFKGQYEVNRQGGVIHWTHKDARGQHEGGWIDYKDKRYE